MTMGVKRPLPASATEIRWPPFTAAGSSRRAAAKTTLPTVSMAIVIAPSRGTPLPSKVPRVRAKRAISNSNTMLPSSGMDSRRRCQRRRPAALRSQARSQNTPPPMTHTSTQNQA